jgi:putative glutamine amidotransferase
LLAFLCIREMPESEKLGIWKDKPDQISGRSTCRKGDEIMRPSEAPDRRRSIKSPRIGVTAALREEMVSTGQNPLERFVRTDLDYVKAVSEAGGSPVVIPPSLRLRAADALLDRLDGLLLSGGPDLDPGYYGEEPMAELGTILPDWDALEMALLGLAIERRIPIFGICRGMQILNVALGGNLYQDVPSQFGSAATDHWQTTPKYRVAHQVEVSEDSYLAEITDGGTVEVNSYHHQGIKCLADGLTVAARSADGVIEAVESRDFSERWLVGVQWHPEGLRDSGPGHRSLFEAHVNAAERHALLRVAA